MCYIDNMKGVEAVCSVLERGCGEKDVTVAIGTLQSPVVKVRKVRRAV